MVRAPCCEKMGLKKGPWTKEEDHILVDYINQHGHSNWRALPKQAGLLRCGKSCRLRWTNYLRPDIKRGNFSKEEEETILSLHESIGNRWSAIAARLPGRTDNEIKNVWHTHLKKKKKRLNQIQTITYETKPKSIKISKLDHGTETDQKSINYHIQTSLKNHDYHPLDSPQISSSQISSVTVGKNDELEDFHEVDENFWSEVWPVRDSGATSNFPMVGAGRRQFPVEHLFGYNYSSMHDGMEYWYELFTRAGDSRELPDF